MARASMPTLLALDRYAAIMGITPAHFNQGVSDIVFPLTASCPDVWYQYSWQRLDSVSREDLADAIATAEQDIANAIRWWPAPVWIEQEAHLYPQAHRPDTFGIGGVNVRAMGKSVRTDYGKVILPGQRVLEPICTADQQGGACEGVLCATCTLAYLDLDNDDFYETARVTITALTETTNACEVKIYFADHDGDPEWEIRPARTKTLTAGTFVADFWSWQFIDPDNWEALPTTMEEDSVIVDLDEDVYVSEVEVYHEYTDTTATSAVFYWEPEPASTFVCTVCLGTGCEACALTTQDGCFHIRDAVMGVVVPTPATYDDDNAQWDIASYATCRDAEQVKLYYYCGNLDQRYLKGQTCDPLSNWWAQTIAALATARLERPFCACGNSAALGELWQRDLALVKDTSYRTTYEDLDNPFGTRRGEVYAWRRIKHLVPDEQRGAGAFA